jgi:hypothetical protein
MNKKLLLLLKKHSHMLDSLREYLKDLGVPEQKHLLDFDKYLLQAIKILEDICLLKKQEIIIMMGYL